MFSHVDDRRVGAMREASKVSPCCQADIEEEWDYAGENFDVIVHVWCTKCGKRLGDAYRGDYEN